MKQILVKLLFNKVNEIFCAVVIGGVTAQLIWDSAYPTPIRVFLMCIVCFSIGTAMPTIFKIPNALRSKGLGEQS